MNYAEIALIIAGAGAATSLIISLAYTLGRLAQSELDDEITATLLAMLTAKKQRVTK